MDTTSRTGYLNGYRVVDLTDFRGLMAGRLLADLGAEVVAVEPPGGGAARTEPPLLGGTGVSRLWAALSHNKKSVTCDIHSADGRALLLRLCAAADFLLVSGTRREVDALGLDADTLRPLNDRLIHVTMTPFGRTGPKAGYADSDLVIWAASGALERNRVDGRVPVRIGTSYQAYFHGASDAVVGALLALAERARSGRGQGVDISFQESLVAANQGQGLYPLVNDVAAGPQDGVTIFPTVWKTSDGYVQFTLTSGPATGHFSNNFMAWVAESGLLPDHLAAVDWRDLPQTSGSGLSASGATKDKYAEKGMGDAERAQIEAIIARFFSTRGTDEILTTARDRRLLLAPILSVADIMDNDHHDARGTWFPTGDADASGPCLPGPFARIRPEAFVNHGGSGAAGAANGDVYGGWLGMTGADVALLQTNGVI